MAITTEQVWDIGTRNGVLEIIFDVTRNYLIEQLSPDRHNSVIKFLNITPKEEETDGLKYRSQSTKNNIVNFVDISIRNPFQKEWKETNRGYEANIFLQYTNIIFPGDKYHYQHLIMSNLIGVMATIGFEKIAKDLLQRLDSKFLGQIINDIYIIRITNIKLTYDNYSLRFYYDISVINEKEYQIGGKEYEKTKKATKYKQSTQ